MLDGNLEVGRSALRSCINATIGFEKLGTALGRSPKARLKKRFAATMARAKRYDAQGNRLGCTRALTAAKRMYVL